MVRVLIQDAGNMPWPQTTRQEKQTIHKLNRLIKVNISDTWHNKRWPTQCQRICAMCVPQKQSNNNKIHVSRMQCTKTQVLSKHYHCNYYTDIFQWYFLNERMGMKGLQTVRTGLYEGKEICQKCLSICFILPTREKK